ncbi:MAG: hypothetical protein WC366_01125 [Bacilli bacterium]|jgi:hypothetical protein
MKTSNSHLKAKIIATSLFGLTAMLAVSQSSGLLKSLLNVNASDDPYVLTMSPVVNKLSPSSGVGTSDVSTTSGNPVSLYYRDFSTSDPMYWCLLGMSGELYNTSPITGITRVDIVMSGNLLEYTVEFSWIGYESVYALKETAYSTYTHSFTDSKPMFFRIKINDAAGVSYVTSIVITYSCMAEPV